MTWRRLLIAFGLTGIVAGVCAGQSPQAAPAQAPSTPEIVIVPPERRNVPGQRLTLTLGDLYIPDHFRASADGSVNLVIFFHGAAWVAEQSFYSARLNSALYSISMKSYQEAFEKKESFRDLLNEVKEALEKNLLLRTARINRICLASFSGGYVAIREILKNRDSYARITDLVLADSLYCAYEDPQTRSRLRVEQLTTFLSFARDASMGKKRMWFTHLYPPEQKYRDNTTTRTASYLIDQLKGARVEQNETNRLGMVLLYSCDVGDFHVRGYSGMTHQDHFNHFYNLTEYLARISFADRQPSVPSR